MPMPTLPPLVPPSDDQVHNPHVGRPMGGEAAPPDPCISLAGLTPGLEIQLDFGRAVIHAEMEHPATLVENGLAPLASHSKKMQFACPPAFHFLIPLHPDFSFSSPTYPSLFPPSHLLAGSPVLASDSEGVSPALGGRPLPQILAVGVNMLSVHFTHIPSQTTSFLYFLLLTLRYCSPHIRPPPPPPPISLPLPPLFLLPPLFHAPFSNLQLALVETNSSRAKPSPTSASASTRLSTPPNHPRPYTTALGSESGQGLGCDLDRSFLVNVVMKQEGTKGVQVVFERTSIVWPFYTDLSLVWEFLEVVAGYFQKPGCVLGPASLQPDSWLMVNILLHMESFESLSTRLHPYNFFPDCLRSFSKMLNSLVPSLSLHPPTTYHQDFDLLLPVPEESLINVYPPPSSSQHSSSRCTDPPLATPSPITADSPAFHSAQSRMPPPSTPPDRFYDASEALTASLRSSSTGGGGGAAAAAIGFGRSGSSGSEQFDNARNTFEEPVWVPELQVWSDDVDLFLSELKAHGLKIRGQTLRVGHFAGGDRESKLLVDFIRVSSVFIHQSQYFAPHDLFGEFTAQLLFSQHSPKCANRQASLLSLHITPDLHPSFSSTAPSPSATAAAAAAFAMSTTGGQSGSSCIKSGRLPIYFVFSQHLVVFSSFLRTLSIRLKRSEGNLLHQKNLELYGDPLPPAFVPSKLAINLQIHELFVALIDDRMGNPTSVLELVAKGIVFNANSQILTEGGPELLSCRLSLTLLSNFLNSGFEVLPSQLSLFLLVTVVYSSLPLPIMEPMTESWQLGADVKSTGNHVTIAVQSHQLLNVMFTPMQLRSLGDALNFYSLLSNSLSVLPGGSLHGGSDRGEKDEEKSKTYSVEEGEEQVLEVQPVQKVVTLRDTRKILARTICVKLKGDWLPINDIVMDKVSCSHLVVPWHGSESAHLVKLKGDWLLINDIVMDKVGKYVMDLRLPGSTVVLPVVFDVTLKSRTKIITVHSTMHLRNDLDVPLVFFALLPSPKETGGENAKSSSQVSKFTLGGLLCSLLLQRCFCNVVPRSIICSTALQLRADRLRCAALFFFLSAITSHEIFMPIFAALGGQLMAQAQGFARAEKDVVALDPEHLLEQQGLLEFPILNQGTRSPLVGRGSSGSGSNRLLSRFGSMTRRHSDGGGSLRLSDYESVRRGSMVNGGEDEFDRRSSGVGTSEEEFDNASDVRRPFYCCLQVISDPLAHSASNGLYEEFTLSFVPPVAIQNGLPYDLEAFVWDVEWGTRHIVYVPS
ncbi:unnamed protein product, partial [Closterium sp. NIES-53]